MNEREQLLNNISNSFESMKIIEIKENICDRTEESINRLKKFCRIRILFIYIFCAAFISKSFDLSLQFIVLAIAVSIWIVSKAKLKSLKSKLQKKENDLHNSKSDVLLQWLPMSYRDSTSYKLIAGYVNNMRANTLQEALNLMETEMHQARLEVYTVLKQ